MESKRMIEIDEGQRLLIIQTLNEKRNELVLEGRDTGFVDDTLLAVIAAPLRWRGGRER